MSRPPRGSNVGVRPTALYTDRPRVALGGGPPPLDDFPVETDFLWCRDAAYDSWTNEALLRQKRSSDDDEVNIGNDGAPEYKFNTAAHLQHLEGGGEASCPIAYDQNGVNDLSAPQPSDEPLILSDGDLVSDDDYMATEALPDFGGDNFSYGFVFSSTDGGGDVVFMSNVNGSAGVDRNWMPFYGTSTNEIILQYNVGAAFNTPAISNGSQWIDGNKHLGLVSYDVLSGLTCHIDGVDQTISPNPTGNTVNNLTAPIALGFLPGDPLNKQTNRLLLVRKTSLTAQEMTDIFDWVVDRGLLEA